jgi:AraC family transcriptional regulator of adaptative response/methylated-DNA-[protein]-cysteine methyltransferase
VQTLLEELQNDPYLRIKDYHLRERGIEPASLRRWFLKHHGITFHAFQRMLRVNTAYKKIREGEPVAGAAFDSGFDSLSAFQDSFKSLVGFSPSESRKKSVIDITRFETPLGPMFAAATADGICLLEFSDRRMLETQFKSLSRLLNASIIQGNNLHFNLLRGQLNEYFSGERHKFELPLITPGSNFQNKVWTELQTIPYGTTRSYEEQAIAIGNPAGVRAVAHANGQNRIAIIIPCHRVIGKDGHLTGYGGGLWRKRWLLDFEKKNLLKEK